MAAPRAAMYQLRTVIGDRSISCILSLFPAAVLALYGDVIAREVGVASSSPGDVIAADLMKPAAAVVDNLKHAVETLLNNIVVRPATSVRDFAPARADLSFIYVWTESVII